VRSALLALVAACGDNLAIEDAAPLPDLQFVPQRMTSWTIATPTFRDPDCEVVEQCVAGPGTRRILQFNTVTANRGAADLRLGRPPPDGQSDATFQWSSCHKHHHYAGYVDYELIGPAGRALVASKRAFCLQDNEQVQPGAASSGFSCQDQGISRGWADSYTIDLPCQFVDVTDVPPGAYTLRLEVNPAHALPESDYTNNVFTFDVTL
jgi:hypothetical protein